MIYNPIKYWMLALQAAGVMAAGLVSVHAEDAALADAKKLGRTNYATCMACHGPDGKGIQAGPMTMAPSLLDSRYVKDSPEAVALIIMKGIKKEDMKFMQQMLPLEAALDDAKLAGVITHVRSMAGIEELTTPEEVAEWRAKYADIKTALSRDEIAEKFPPAEGAEGDEGSEGEGEKAAE